MDQEVLDAPKVSAVKIYNPIEAGIALLMEKHGDVLITPPDVSTTKALEATKKNRTELVKFRTAIEGARVKEKAESLAYGKLVDSEAKRITAIAAPIEKAYDDAITAEETRLEAIRQAEIEAERKRIAGHIARIQTIKDVRETANLCRTSDRLKTLIDGMPALVVGDFEEFNEEAMTAFNEVCTVLGQLHAAKVEQENAAAALALQQAELKRQQEEQARIEREARELREKQEAEDKARRDTEAAALKKQADELAAREAELQRREAAAAAPVQTLAPITATVLTYDDEVAAFAQAVMATPAISMNRCCEKADSLGVAVCPECAEINDGYQSSMGPADLDETSDGEVIAVAVQAVAGHFGMTPDEALIRLSEIAEWQPLEVA